MARNQSGFDYFFVIQSIIWSFIDVYIYIYISLAGCDSNWSMTRHYDSLGFEGTPEHRDSGKHSNPKVWGVAFIRRGEVRGEKWVVGWEGGELRG